MTLSKFTRTARGLILSATTVAIFTATIGRAEPPPGMATLSPDAVKTQSRALSSLILAQIRALPANGTSADDYEAAIVQVIAQSPPNQDVQVSALTSALAVKGLPAYAYVALRRVLEAAKAGRLAGTGAISGNAGGFQTSSSFSAPIINLGGGSVNYSTP